MRRIHDSTGCAVAMAVALSLSACSDGGTAPASGIGAVVVTAPQTEFEVGSTVQLAVTLLDESGVALSGGRVDWTSSHTSVASVSSAGLVVGRAGGTTRITASSGDKSGFVDLRVRPQSCTPSVSRTIGTADARSGTLSPSDCRFVYGQSAQGWRLSIPSATVLRVDLSSSSFAPFVAITDLHMNVLAGGAVGGNNTTSSIVQDFAAGEYIVWVANDGPTEGGSYQLATRTHTRCASPGDRSIGTEDRRDGTIAPNDCMFLHGELAQGWRLDVQATTTLQIDLVAERFPGLLVLTDPQMMVLKAAWVQAPGATARLVATLAAGEYIVWATSYGPGADGPYRLTTALTTIPSCTAPVGTIAVGESVDGELVANDCQFNESRSGDPWLLVVPAQTTLRIDMTSPTFDTYLYVTDRNGGIIAADDDSGEHLNSRLTWTFAPGEYLVLASSFVPGATGPYRLSVSLATGISPSRASTGSEIPTRARSHLEGWLSKRRR